MPLLSPPAGGGICQWRHFRIYVVVEGPQYSHRSALAGAPVSTPREFRGQVRSSLDDRGFGFGAVRTA
jgi:hypothetical protein